MLVSLELENTGEVEGKEVVQVYVDLNEKEEIQPVRKLAAFKKVSLKPGEKKEVSFRIPVDAFRYYSVLQREFVYATGVNTIEIGKSSRDIALKDTVEISENNRKYKKIHENTTIGEVLAIPALKEITEKQINQLIVQLDMTGEEAVNPKELEQAMFYMPLRNIVQISNGEFSRDSLNKFIGMLNVILGYE